MTWTVNGAGVMMAIEILIKASVLVAVAALVHHATHRRASASARHLGWTFTVVSLLLLPCLVALLPAWNLAVRVAARAPVVRVAEVTAPLVAMAPLPQDAMPPQPVERNAPLDRWPSWQAMMLAIYVTGAALLLVRLAVQWRSVTRLASRATAIDDPAWTRLLAECARLLNVTRPVRLLRSRDRTMPMALGTRAPAILLPVVADTWSEERRRAVLLHELAHVGRHDCLTQMLAAVACAVYWMHPGVWWAARQLRLERELACDDRVLMAGAGARDYAGHLLELAHSLGGGRAPALAVSMARPRQLEGRMLAVLDIARNRTMPGLRGGMAGVALTAMLMVPVAIVRPIIVTADATMALALPPTELMLARPLDAPAEPTPALPRASTPLSQHRPDVEPSVAEAARASRRVNDSAAAAQPFAQATGSGTWEIRQSQTAGTVHLRMTEGTSSSGSTMPLDRLEGLTSSQLSAGAGPVRFTIRRDAGTFSFEGTARDGVAAGIFTFTASPTFAADLDKRGIGRPSADEQYALARHDIGFGFLDELRAQNYPRADIAQLVRAGQHGARLEYLRDMGAAGYRLPSLEALITLRDHGVTPSFIQELAAQGYKGLSADELQRARDHGVNGEFARQFRDQGYTSLTIDQLVKARDHGVNGDLARDLAALGHRTVQVDALIRLRDHGVSSSYMRELRELGQSLTLDQLVTARDHGVSTDYIRDLVALGYRDLPIESLVRMRDHGVSANYVKELKELGYERLAIDDLISLRDHGVSADRIRRANTRAGTRLPLDMLRALSNGGLR